jgi:inosine-uridine nucleoside N-ribohydrolase
MHKLWGCDLTTSAARGGLYSATHTREADLPLFPPTPPYHPLPHVADFVHGSDGLGHVDLPDPISKQIEQSAADFLVDKVFQFPGEVSVLALGPPTNVALVCLTSSDAVERWHF